MKRRLKPTYVLLLLLLVAILAACNVVPTGTPPPTTNPESPVPTPQPPPPTPDPNSPIPTPEPEPDDHLPVHITYLTSSQANKPTIVITLDYDPAAVTIVLKFNPDSDKE